jgi:hypothetical protein
MIPDPNALDPCDPDSPQPERRVKELKPGVVYRVLCAEWESNVKPVRRWDYGILNEETGGLYLTSGGCYPSDWIPEEHYWIEETDHPFEEYVPKVRKGMAHSRAVGEYCESRNWYD